MAIIKKTNDLPTANEIIKRMYWNFHQTLVVPNIHLHGWWECDLLRMTKAGYLYEYEIKLSVSDFRADFKKERGFLGNYKLPQKSIKRTQVKLRTEKKHDLLNDGAECCPNYFNFVLPYSIYEKVKDEIPEYAGVFVLYFNKHRPQELIKAPKIHGTKNTNAKEQMLTSTYHRFWSLMNKTDEQNQNT